MYNHIRVDLYSWFIRVKNQRKVCYCSDVDGKREEIAKSVYNMGLSGLGRGPGKVVFQEDISFSSVVKTPTIIEEDNEIVPERVSSFVNEVADILRRVVKHEDQRTCSQLVYLMLSTSLNLNSLMEPVESVAGC